MLLEQGLVLVDKVEMEVDNILEVDHIVAALGLL